jgi:hypothetical protein
MRREMGAGIDDEDLLLAAFYEKDLLAPLKNQAFDYKYQTSPMMELIRYVGGKSSSADRVHLRYGGAELTVGR